MPKLKPDTHRAREENILDAAELCFARAGFHATTIEEICKQANVSAGALYVYFKSKEDLITGIAERERSKLAARLADVAKAPDLMAAIEALGQHYMIDEPRHKKMICIEIACESVRNEAIGKAYRSVEDCIRQGFTDLFEKARADGKIRPEVDSETLAAVVSIIGDGLSWHRAVDPNLDMEKTIPVIMKMVGLLLNPVEGAHDVSSDEKQEAVA